MDNVIATLKSLQEHTEEGFKSLTNELRVEMRHASDVQQAAIESLRVEIRNIDAKAERMNRWVIGLFVTNFFATVAMLARPYLNV